MARRRRDPSPARGADRARSPVRFRFDRCWGFEIPPGRMWSLVSDTAAFPRLWPWLRSFEPAPLERGATTHCAIGAPLPYLVRLRIEVVDLIPERLVVVDVNGDLRGPARLEIGPTPLGSSARLVWDLELCRPLLRRAARVAAPVLRWGHNRVVDRGVEQFRRAALGPVVT